MLSLLIVKACLELSRCGLTTVSSYRAWRFLNFLDRYSSLKTANATMRGVLGPNRFESRFHSIPGGKFHSHPKLFDATQIFDFWPQIDGLR